jgi:hypothetical protein
MNRQSRLVARMTLKFMLLILCASVWTGISFLRRHQIDILVGSGQCNGKLINTDYSIGRPNQEHWRTRKNLSRKPLWSSSSVQSPSAPADGNATKSLFLRIRSWISKLPIVKGKSAVRETVESKGVIDSVVNSSNAFDLTVNKMAAGSMGNFGLSAWYDWIKLSVFQNTSRNESAASNDVFRNKLDLCLLSRALTLEILNKLQEQVPGSYRDFFDLSGPYHYYAVEAARAIRTTRECRDFVLSVGLSPLMDSLRLVTQVEIESECAFSITSDVMAAILNILEHLESNEQCERIISERVVISVMARAFEYRTNWFYTFRRLFGMNNSVKQDELRLRIRDTCLRIAHFAVRSNSASTHRIFGIKNVKSFLEKIGNERDSDSLDESYRFHKDRLPSLTLPQLARVTASGLGLDSGGGIRRRGVRVLSLDGGGVKGVISVIILRRLLSHIHAQSGRTSSDLSDHFDLICGTSTGGIIAALLGLLRMPIQEVMIRRAHVLTPSPF